MHKDTLRPAAYRLLLGPVKIAATFEFNSVSNRKHTTARQTGDEGH